MWSGFGFHYQWLRPRGADKVLNSALSNESSLRNCWSRSRLGWRWPPFRPRCVFVRKAAWRSRFVERVLALKRWPESSTNYAWSLLHV